MRNKLVTTTSFLSLLALPAYSQIEIKPYSIIEVVNEMYIRPMNISGNGAVAVGASIEYPDNSATHVWNQNGSFDFRGYLSDADAAEITSVHTHGLSYDGRFLVGVFNRAVEPIPGIPYSPPQSYGYILDAEDGTYMEYQGLDIRDVDDFGTSFVATSHSDEEYEGSIWMIADWEGDKDIYFKLLGAEGSQNTHVNAMDGAGKIAVGYHSDFVQGPSAVYWNLDKTVDSDSLSAVSIPKFENKFSKTLPIIGGEDAVSSSEREPDTILTSRSQAIDVSRNGNYVIGWQTDEIRYNQADLNDAAGFLPVNFQSLDRSFIYQVGAPETMALVEIPVLDGLVQGISDTGRAVGNVYANYSIKMARDSDVNPIPIMPSAWVFDMGSDSARSVSQWLSEGGVQAGNVSFLTADAISNDGNVIAGTMQRSYPTDVDQNSSTLSIPYGYGYTIGYIADIRRGVIGTEAYQQSSNEAAQQTASISNFMNTILNGSHHVPLQMQGAGRYAWTTADYARNDRFDTDSALAEVGSAVDLMEKQLVAGLGVGQSWVDQGLSLGGDADLSGQYLVSELSYRATGTPYIFSLTGAYGMWDADIDRNYLNGASIDTSRGETDVNSGSVRLRADWLDAAHFLGFGITPKIEYAFNQTKTDSYTETGTFANSYNNQRESIHQTRYGLTAARNVLQDKGHVRLRFEGVHRFDDGKNISSATIVGINNTFDIVGPGVKQNWLLYGVDFNYALNEQVSLTSGIQSSTSGQDPIFGSSLGMRVSF